jgi:hypothetical protein
MKSLIVFMILVTSAFAQLTPEQRRINERATALKELSASHCAQLPLDLRTECQNNFKDELRAAIRKQSKRLVSDAIVQADNKVNSQLKEEGLLVEFGAKLAAENISHNCTTSACMITLFNEVMAARREAKCLADAKALADSLGVTYAQSDTCQQVSDAISEFQLGQASGNLIGN